MVSFSLSLSQTHTHTLTCAHTFTLLLSHTLSPQGKSIYIQDYGVTANAKGNVTPVHSEPVVSAFLQKWTDLHWGRL